MQIRQPAALPLLLLIALSLVLILGTVSSAQPSFDILKLQMKVVKLGGEEAMAMMMKNYFSK